MGFHSIEFLKIFQFYINYEECKSKRQIINAEYSAMFYINYEECKFYFFLSTYHGNKSFILTMRNVNLIYQNGKFFDKEVLY